jgi:tetratricopeptide (TPR) repeat protein
LGEKKRYDEASSLLEEAVVNFTRSGSLSAAGMAWSLHAGHLIAQDRLDAAEPILRQADKALRETNYVERIAENEERYAHYWKKRKDPTKAREAAEKAALTFDQLGAVDRAKALRAYFAGD